MSGQKEIQQSLCLAWTGPDQKLNVTGFIPITLQAVGLNPADKKGGRWIQAACQHYGFNPPWKQRGLQVLHNSVYVCMWSRGAPSQCLG